MMILIALEVLFLVGVVLFVVTQIFIPLIYNKPFFPALDRVRQKISREKELAELKQYELEQKQKLNTLTSTIDRQEIENFAKVAKDIEEMSVISHTSENRQKRRTNKYEQI